MFSSSGMPLAGVALAVVKLQPKDHPVPLQLHTTVSIILISILFRVNDVKQFANSAD